MIFIKNKKQIEIMREAGKILAQTMATLKTRVKEGISTLELDQLAEGFILSQGAQPAFRNYGGKNNPFPATLCTSINEQVVHGIPRKNVFLKKGDIISLDCGVKFKGYYSDMALTCGVEEISLEKKNLLKTTKTCLDQAIIQAKHGNRLGDISWAVQSWAEKNNYSVVKELTGHGIGKNLHEKPSIFNFGDPGTGPVLKSGMVIAIEPMVNIGDWPVEVLDDGWTVVTKDRSLSAHFENTVLITKKGGEVLSKI